MEKLHFNRLIRDKVFQKLIDKGLEFKVEKLSLEHFRSELLKKIPEEGEGLIAAKTREEFLSEFADIRFVLDEIQKNEGITDEELKKAQEINFRKKGGFTQKIFLHWTSNDGYETNEKINSQPKE